MSGWHMLFHTRAAATGNARGRPECLSLHVKFCSRTKSAALSVGFHVGHAQQLSRDLHKPAEKSQDRRTLYSSIRSSATSLYFSAKWTSRSASDWTNGSRSRIRHGMQTDDSLALKTSRAVSKPNDMTAIPA